MQRRRVLLFATALSAPLVVVAVACSFPDVTFAPADGAVGETSSSGSLPDVLAPETSNVVVVDGGGASDAAERPDGQEVVDPNECNNPDRRKCDCDRDGYRDEECILDGGGTIDASGLAPGDCDDLDPFRNPDASFSKETIPASAKPPAGDWDCNTIVERDPISDLKCNEPEEKTEALPLPQIGFKTTYRCMGGTTGQNQGFRGKPPCGTEDDLYECPSSVSKDSRAECLTPVLAVTRVVETCK